MPVRGVGKLDTISVVQVSVQSVEVTLIGHDAAPQIVVNGTLKNVARGHMVLTVHVTDCAHVGGIGELEIEETRPVMKATVAIGQRQFDALVDLLRGAPPRPASVLLALQEGLPISSQGHFSPDYRRVWAIADVSWSIPIQ